jgi:predicted RNA-binding protein with PUA-like domain
MAVKYFLAKTDPETYSLIDFEAEKKTVWDGVKNAQALQAIRAMSKGDMVFVYHSVKEAAVVGLARVASEPRPDAKDPKLAVVDFEFVARLDPPTTLTEIKQSGLFPDFALVRQSRLSTMAVPGEFVAWMRTLYPKSKI